MNIIKDILDIMMNICLAMHFIIKFRELKKKSKTS